MIKPLIKVIRLAITRGVIAPLKEISSQDLEPEGEFEKQ
jgi:hypothetical protein